MEQKILGLKVENLGGGGGVHLFVLSSGSSILRVDPGMF